MGTNFYLKRKLSEQEKALAKELLDNDKYDEVRDILPKNISILLQKIFQECRHHLHLYFYLVKP